MCAYCHLSFPRCSACRCLLTWPPKTKQNKKFNFIILKRRSNDQSSKWHKIQWNNVETIIENQWKIERKKNRPTDRPIEQQRSKWNERLTFYIKKKYLFLWVSFLSLLNHIKSHEKINWIMFSDFSVSKSTSVNLRVLCIPKCHYCCLIIIIMWQ